MNAYLFQASLLCGSCGASTRAAIRAQGKAPADESNEHTYDSEDFPKGPYPDGGGEADRPQHCDSCGRFLENPLTNYGVQYVRERMAEAVANGRKIEGCLADWLDFYRQELET
jgi:hypothetical protein